jgi:hypothetical protein
LLQVKPTMSENEIKEDQNDEKTDLPGAFGNQLGTFTGTWRVHLRDVDSEYAKTVIAHFDLAAPTPKAGQMYFTMTKLEVGRSAARLTIQGPMSITGPLFTPLEAQNAIYWYFADRQHMVSPF